MMYTAAYIKEMYSRLNKARQEIYYVGEELEKIMHFLEVKEKEPIALSNEDKRGIVAEVLKSMTAVDTSVDPELMERNQVWNPPGGRTDGN